MAPKTKVTRQSTKPAKTDGVRTYAEYLSAYFPQGLPEEHPPEENPRQVGIELARQSVLRVSEALKAAV